MPVDAETGVASLAECGQLFFDHPEDSAVLPNANPCFRAGVDRFVLSCPVMAHDYSQLWSRFQTTFDVKELRCKRKRLRGLRITVSVHDSPHAQNAGASGIAPQIDAPPVKVGLSIYHGKNGHYFGAQGNGRFTPSQWHVFHHLLTTHFPKPTNVSVARIEVYVDFALPSDYVAILPLGAKHRFCLQENGFYYGARPSQGSLAMYERQILPAGSSYRYTHVEARLRARVAPSEVVAQCVPFFRRFGIYMTSSPHTMLHLPYAWRAADTRARTRFLDRIKPFRLQVDEHGIEHAVDLFAAAVVPPAFLLPSG